VDLRTRCRGRRAARPLRPALLLVAFALALAGPTGAGTAGASPGFTFTGSGWGHGVGMSQWGARGWAEQGWSAARILTHYYSGTAVQVAPVSDDLRVLLGTGSFTLTAGGPTTLRSTGGGTVATVGTGAVVTLTRSGGGLALGGAATGWVPSLSVSPGGTPLRVSPPGYRYAHGTLVVSPDSGGGLRAVRTGLTMQQYLYGLGEMPSSWPAAALQAQAVAARTFAQRLAGRANRSSSDFDLHGGLPHQSYIGWEKEGGAMGDRWRAAVDATAGQVVAYGGVLIDAVYSASSGGHTENSEVVWVSALPYLRGVPDPADLAGGNPNASWSRTYSGEQLGAWFGVGTVTSVQVLGPLGASGRVDKATIRLVGTAGTRDVRGDSFRSTVNQRSPRAMLMSSRFTVSGGGAPPPPATPAPPLAGAVEVARAEGRRIVVGGWASGPSGPPTVRVVSTMGRQVAVRDVRADGGRWSVAWSGSPGTRRVCVTALSAGATADLGCHDVVVK
jgi:SpoIID/LytB domain protein